MGEGKFDIVEPTTKQFLMKIKKLLKITILKYKEKKCTYYDAMKKIHQIKLSKFPDKGYYQYDLLEDTQDFSANVVELLATKTLNISKGVLNQHVLDLINSKTGGNQHLYIFPVQFITQADTIVEKQKSEELLWGFKQKKYKRLQKYYFTAGNKYNPKTFEVIGVNNLVKNSPVILKSQLIGNFKKIKYSMEQPDNFNYHRAIKYNKHRSELVPVTLARRLLRTKRTLVLPAHTNITVITNSYDVVHS